MGNVTRKRKNADFLNGVPELLILRTLAERPMYGYELIRALSESTRESLSFGEGVIYPMLHSLEGDGLLAARRETVNGRPRVYYRLTGKGARRLKKSADRWRRVADSVHRALGGGGVEPTSV